VTFSENVIEIFFNGNQNFTLSACTLVLFNLLKINISGRFLIKNIDILTQTSEVSLPNDKMTVVTRKSIAVECENHQTITDFFAFPEIDINRSHQTNIFSLQYLTGITGMKKNIYTALYNVFEKSDNTQFAQNIELIAEVMTHRSQVLQFHRNKIAQFFGYNTFAFSAYERAHKFLIEGALG